MRKFLLVLFGIAVVIASVAQNIGSNQVVYWPMDNGNGDDASGNGKHATLGNGVGTWSNKKGVPASAFYFDGINDYAEFPLISLTDATIAFDIRPKTISGFHNIIYGHGTKSRLYFNSNGRLTIEMTQDGDEYNFNYTLKLDEWQHVAVVTSGNNHLLYVDGQHLETGTTATNGMTLKFLGKTSPDRNFNGVLDEVRIYNRALSPEEINILFQMSSFPTSNWDSNGNVTYELEKSIGIGTSTTGSHKLAVEGSIGAREVLIDTDSWPDFVFEAAYDLRDLEEVETFIQQHNHLPEIPSEEEVIKNGVNLGEIDAKLLMKIEELTLYLIEQNKRIKALETKNEELMKLLKDE